MCGKSKSVRGLGTTPGTTRASTSPAAALDEEMEAELCFAAPVVVRHWWFEPLVATLSFALWINVFRVVERGGLSRAALGDVFDVRRGTRVLRAGAAYAAGVACFRSVAPAAPVDWRCPTAAAFVGELAFGVVAYDALFYVVHRAAHACGPFGRAVAHRRHHGSAAACVASDVVDHSLADGGLQVLANIVAQRWAGPTGGPKNFAARLAHNVLVAFLLTDAHAATNRRVSRRFPNLLRGADRHRAHHRRGGPPYQQFFGYLDALFSPDPS